MIELTHEELETLKQRSELYDQMYELYRTDNDYRLYVDRCAKTDNISPEICLLRRTVQEVGLYYIDRKKGKEPNQPFFADREDISEDKAC